MECNKSRLIWVGIIILLYGFDLKAQVKYIKIPGEPQHIICYAAKEPNDFHIPPPEVYLKRLKSANEKVTNFRIKYDFDMPSGARTAFKKAADIWSTIVYSPVTIYVEVRWEEMESGALGGTLLWPYYLIRQHNILPVLLYPVTIAEKIAGRDLNDKNDPDVIITMNKDISWWYDTENEPPLDRYDFLTVSVHELTHGLGFDGGFFEDNERKGNYYFREYFIAFDYYFENSAGIKISDTTKYPIPSIELQKQLTLPPIYFNSPLTFNQTGKTPQMWVPRTWDPGSSLYHLDDKYNNTKNALMTYSTAPGESIHDPGSLTLNMLYETGWIHTKIEHDSSLDRETLEESDTIAAQITSDVPFKSGSQQVFYSFNKSDTWDSIKMTSTDNPGEYAADIPLTTLETHVNYYVSVIDKYNRRYTLPSNAPESSFNFYVGADTTAPIVDHLPIEFMLVTKDTLEITTNVWDNLGIDTVLIEYQINEGEQTAVGLSNDSASIYAGLLIFESGILNVGDIIKYRIKAVDKAVAGNTTYLPKDSLYQFAVEEIPEYQDSYENDFEISIKDFLRNGFEREKPLGFSNYALQTKHPYPAPSKDNTSYEFVAQLRIPIKLRPGDAFMYFDEIALIEPGEDGTVYGDDEFWDYVIVEGSNDQGETWYSFEDGYDCRRYESWETLFNSNLDYRNNISRALPTEENYRPHLINMLGNTHFSENEEVLIRFRLYSDPYFNGWGWAIDNLRIQGELSSIEDYDLIAEAIKVFPNPSTGNVNLSIRMKRAVDELSIELVDMVGKLLLRENYSLAGNSFEESFNLSEYPNGVYFFRIHSGNQMIVKKVMLAR